MNTLKPDTFLTEAAFREASASKDLVSASKIYSPATNRSVKIQKYQEQEDDEIDELDKKRIERKWTLLLKKISFPPDSEDYYSLTPIKPGFFFWKTLAKTPINDLQINIPDSLIYLDQPYLMFTDERTGKVVKKSEASYAELESRLLASNREFVRKNRGSKPDEVLEKIDYETNPDLAFIVSRSPANVDYLCSKSVFSYRTHKERRVGGNEVNKLEQKYIISRTLNASIFRLCFHTRNSNSTKANYGFRITNYLDILNTNKKIPLIQKASICSDKDNSFHVLEVNGLGLHEFEVYAERVVTFLEKTHCVRISEVVLDFIKDLDKKIWLINMKSIKMDIVLSMNEISGVGEGKKTLDDLTCSVYCKLCGLLFKKDDASKVLTYKLLWELVQHLKKRGKTLPNIKVSHSSTRPCRVCNLCYMLVVGEHELIEIEQSFARAQNIPIYDAVNRVPVDTKPKHRPALLGDNLYQWRLMFYVNEIYGVEQNLINVDLNDFYLQIKMHTFKTCLKINATFKENKFDQSTIKENQNFMNTNSSSRNNLHLYKIGSTNAFKKRNDSESLNSSPKNFYQSPPHLSINKVRVHYFFSETDDVEKFLLETEIKIRLTKGTDWNNFVAEGSSKTISHFQNKQMGGQRHNSQILCFFENSKYCTLKMSPGLVCDGQYNTENLNLYKFNGIYFPDENFYNSDPFPNEWMEMYDPNSVKLRDQIQEKVDYEKYSPKCTISDLNKMIDYDAYKGRNSFKNVESKIKRAQSASNYKMLPKNILDPMNQLNEVLDKRTEKEGIEGISTNSPQQANLNLESGQKALRPYSSFATSIKKEPQKDIASNNNQLDFLKMNEAESLDKQLEAFDAYNLLMDKKAYKNEKEHKIMKEYELLSGDEENVQEASESQIEKKSNRKAKNLRIRTNKIKKKEKQLYVDSNDYKNFLNEKKKKAVGLYSSDFTENM